jgi:ABC-2 type transport system permease protein
MKHYLTAYATCVKIALSQALAYRASFLLSCLITLAGNLAFPLITLLIYGAGASFPGWGFYEVLLIQSTFTLSAGLSGLVLGAVIWVTMLHVREGTFETVLLRPVHPLFYIVSTTFEPENAGLTLGGLALLCVSAAGAVREGAAITAASALSFAALFLAGLLVMGGIALIMSAASFRWVGNSRLPEMFGSIQNFGRYPLPIFPKAVQTAVTFVIPVGMVGFFPAAALLGRGTAQMWAAIPLCALFFGFGVWLYNRMIRLYQGVGG